MAIYTIEREHPRTRYNYHTHEYETKYSKGDIEMTHEGRFITFKKDWAPNTEYKYDLVTGEFIRVRHFKTKEDKEERVQRKNAASWFGRCDLITSDAKWARLYYYAKTLASSRSNMSWFIDKFASPQVKMVEQWMGIGIKLEVIERMFNNSSSNYYYGWREDRQVLHAPNEYNKKLLNYIKEKAEDRGSLTFTFLNECYDHWNNGQYGVFKKIEQKIEEEPQYSPVFRSPLHDWSDYDYDILHNNSAKELRNTIIKTMQTYNLDLDAFVEYCLYLLNSESINIAKLMADYPDYLRRELVLQGKMSKMNKYPECWLTTTHKQQKEFNNLQRLRQLEQNGGSEEFNNSIEANKHLEWKDGNYLIRMPKDAEDIRDEASQMHHCVATYIPDIEAGKRIVMFMRDKDHPERSLVTVEVINGAVTQAYAEHDSHPDMSCKIWLTKWAMEKGLRITAITLK